MGITAMALALVVLTLAAGGVLWTLVFHFEEFYPVAKERASHARWAGLLFRTVAGITAVAIFAVLLLEFQQLITS
jgi:hypothetical protein